VHAELARGIAAARGASWWYVITGLNATPLSIGRIRSRPTADVASQRGYAGAEIWLQVDAATLKALVEQTHPPAWERVLTEIAGKAGLDDGPPNRDAKRRLPGTALRRWVAARDRTCAFPGCGVPAHRSDADHSVEPAQGGETIDTNIGPNCRHDHRLRHEGGWTITQTEPGHFTWTSRLGRTYHRRLPPSLDDLPDPMPTAETDEDSPAEDGDPSTEDWQNSTCMVPDPPRPPEPQQPPPLAPPPAEHDEDPPPF
jgi:hypothetical protein